MKNRIALSPTYNRLCRVPVLGVSVAFWGTLVTEGVAETCKPRWGMLTFAYLNDGISPTVYHTVRSIIDPATPIYPLGAPRNKREAEAA